jgi:hypothetical protein
VATAGRSGIGVVSRWPITQRERQALRGDDGEGNGEALLTVIDGLRGPVQVFVVMLDYPLHASGLRQAQVRQLAAFVARASHRRHRRTARSVPIVGAERVVEG